MPLVWFDGGGTKRALVAPTVQRLKSPPIETMVEGRMELVWLWSFKLLDKKEPSFELSISRQVSAHKSIII